MNYICALRAMVRGAFAVVMKNEVASLMKNE